MMLLKQARMLLDLFAKRVRYWLIVILWFTKVVLCKADFQLPGPQHAMVFGVISPHM